MKEKWNEIPGTHGEFFRGETSGKVRHKSQLWKNQVFEDDWFDVPGYEGLYRYTLSNGRPIIFAIKRDELLDVTRGRYTLSKNGEKEQFTEAQFINFVTRDPCVPGNI